INPLYLPSVAAFANQTAIAYRNAQLLQGLRESEEQYRNIFVSVTDGLTIFDEDGYILAVNPAACRIYGYSEDELVGMHLSTLVHPEHYHDLENFRRAIAEDGVFHGQAVNIRKDGALIDVEVHGTAFTYQGRRCLLSVDTDVTDKVRSHQALMRSEKLRTLGQMAGGIAHDFNNLLAGIRGFANLALLEMREDPAAASDDLRMALVSTTEAAEAVRRIQSLYRSGEDTSDFAPLRLDQVVHEALALTQPHWKDVPQSRGVTIRTEVEVEAQPTVQGNAAELRRVVSNLVMNAVDAMPLGGALHLRIGADDEWCTLTVEDTGVGMTEAQQRQVFEPFFTTKGTMGSGLGLTMSLSIVERHGGHIVIQSAPGKGSTFVVHLPITEEEAGPEPPAAPETDALALRHLRVLVVDDDPSVLSVLTRLLQREGQHVTAVSGGAEAIDLLRQTVYDLLITDLGMPNISGHQVARLAHDLHPEMPVVLATGWGETISPEQLGSLGATTLLSKPYTYEDVVRAVNTAIQQR
ncbi:MAG: PAS domain S-box protein, partial [Chloroflexi bacterium]|nr:PAS domain S-box protein [Chloroflexota bacterium]